LKPTFCSSKKNYSVDCNNGRDAIDIFENENFDIVFLDENMPGMSGLETLSEMKRKNQRFLIMITKSEEDIMEEG
jgi:DNA-binding response OmpR family regulator